MSIIIAIVAWLAIVGAVGCIAALGAWNMWEGWKAWGDMQRDNERFICEASGEAWERAMRGYK
jgi:hypothetical protein